MRHFILLLGYSQDPGDVRQVVVALGLERDRQRGRGAAVHLADDPDARVLVIVVRGTRDEHGSVGQRIADEDAGGFVGALVGDPQQERRLERGALCAGEVDQRLGDLQVRISCTSPSSEPVLTYAVADHCLVMAEDEA